MAVKRTKLYEATQRGGMNAGADGGGLVTDEPHEEGDQIKLC